MALGQSLGFSTYLFDGAGRKITTDAAGNSYIVGELDPSTGLVFVAKLAPTGAVIWAYSYGGDEAHGVAVDGAGNVFMLARLASESKSLLLKLDPSGAFATAWTYLPLDMNALALAAGNAYLAGSTGGSGEVLVYQFTPSLDPVYGRLFGGSGTDLGTSIAVDGSGNVYVQGVTYSPDLPVAQNSYNGGGDVFLAKIDPTGSSLLFTKYFGNTSFDGYSGLAVDGASNVYMAWQSYAPSGGVPTLFPGAVQSGGGDDVIVTKMTSSGATVWSGRFGGSNTEAVNAVAVDSTGAATIVGWTSSADFPVTGNAAFSAYRGNSDGYILQLNASGSAISYSSYLGGTSTEQISDIALDGSKNAITTGKTQSSDFPVTNGSTPSPTGSSSFATKFLQSSDTTAPTCTITSPTGGNVQGIVPITASASDNVGVTKVELFVDGSLLTFDLYAPYTGSWNTSGAAQGSHAISCKAYDAAGNFGISAAVTVTIPDTIPPVVSITSPAAESTVSGTVNFCASATDNVAVGRVDLKVDGQLIGAPAGSPYCAAWNTTGFVNGSHSLSATAIDTSGNAATAAISVTVSNSTAPVCTLAWNKTTVPSGSSATLTLTATGTIPGGSRAYLSGTKNGVPDFNDLDFGLPPSGATYLNKFGNAGVYRRWVVIRAYDGSTVCTSNVATVTFEAPKCTAAFSKSVVTQGSSVVFSLSSVGDIPSGSISYLYGTKNGVTDEPGNAFSGPNFSYTITNSPGLAGYYVRWLVVKTSTGQTVCQSNQTSTTFQ